MAAVHIPNDWQRYTGGVEFIDLAAPRVQELYDALIERYPGLATDLEKAAVVINGDIYNEAPYHKLEPGTEIHFVPRIAGG
jgi:molybdopterin converting factor small subunit